MKNIPSFTVYKKVLATGALGLFVSSFAHADVTLNVDDNIKVMAINGKEIKTNLLQPRQQNFTLQPGKHVITARYDRLYKLRRDEHDYLKSGNITVVADMQDNQTYRLEMPGQPEKYNDAKQYVKNPTLAVMAGTQVVAQETDVSSNEGIISSLGSKLGGMFGSSDAKLDNERAIAAVNAGVTQAPISGQTLSTPNAAVSNTNANVLDSFMKIWLQATPDEREKIRQWVAQ